MNSNTAIGGIDVRDARTRDALVHSFFDGVFTTIMLGIVETFGVAGALALGVSSVPIALLSPLPVWLGSPKPIQLQLLVDANLVIGRLDTQVAWRS